MIISFQRGYLYFGMPKTGSTTIHYLLGNSSDADIVLSRISHGKHLDCSSAVKKFEDIFVKYPYSNFIKFGVIRDPVKLISSWYRIWSSDELADPNNPKHEYWLEGRTLDEWVDELESPEYDGPRRYPTAEEFYMLDDGTLGVDYLVRNEHMSEDLAKLEAFLPMGFADAVEKTRLNVNPDRAAVGAKSPVIDERLSDRIYNLFSVDADIYGKVDAINKKLLESDPISPVGIEGKIHFRKLYPDLYKASGNNKLRLRVKSALSSIGLFKG